MKRSIGSIKGGNSFARYFLCLVLIIVSTTHLFSQTTALRLSPLFQDNMVLQQRTSVPVWGKGLPGQEVLIRASWGSAVATVVRADSEWSAKLSTPKAGGPFQVSIRQGRSLLIIKNVLVGEVWLCSGQSNMEMPLEGWPPSDTVAGSAGEIDNALYPSIRLYSVMRSYEAEPSESCVGNWTECSPIDVRSFSAAAFYFGKMLYNTLKVPIGLINTSYGGTSIEAWMSKEALQSFAEFTEPLNKLAGSRDSLRSLTEWLIRHPKVVITEQDPSRKWAGLNFGDENCSARDYPDVGWKEMKLPTLWEQTSLGEFDGAVWFRKRVTIPSAWVGKDLVLQLGPVDDMDETYINGKKIGGYLADGFWSTPRVYKIDGAIVRDSLLQLAVRVIDLRGGGGIWGNGTQMIVFQADSTKAVSLEGNWKYLPVAEYRTNTFYVFGTAENGFAARPKLPVDFSPNTPTSLFNAMVNPLIPFAVRGAIWYQGENNVGNPVLYRRLLPALIGDWRKQFDCGDFPFYFVQIAPYNYGPQSQSQLLREAQMQALSVKNTGMVVTLDIGNPKNIHPSDKADVGKRLALLALSGTYGRKLAHAGPIYKSMKIQRSTIVLSFDNAGNGLVLKAKNGEMNFLIAGSDKVFRKAVVRVQGKTMIVSSPDIRMPASVRYAWSNTDEATLFNKEGFPASSFRTDDWKE